VPYSLDSGEVSTPGRELGDGAGERLLDERLDDRLREADRRAVAPLDRLPVFTIALYYPTLPITTARFYLTLLITAALDYRCWSCSNLLPPPRSRSACRRFP